MTKQTTHVRTAAEAAEHRDIPTFTIVVRKLMQEARRDKQPCAFANRGIEYARVVVSTMVQNAENEICVFAREMSRDVYDADLLKTFINRRPKGRINVVVEDKDAPCSASSVLPDLRTEIASGHISLWTLRPEHAEEVDGQNFALVDRIHVRFEENQDTREASVFFGDPDIGKAAAERFERIVAAAEPFVLR